VTTVTPVPDQSDGENEPGLHPTVPSSDRLTWSHLGCVWLGRQLLQRVLTLLGRSQERGRVAAFGRAYTLPASLSI
jgi:hypothetical protein